MAGSSITCNQSGSNSSSINVDASISLFTSDLGNNPRSDSTYTFISNSYFVEYPELIRIQINDSLYSNFEIFPQNVTHQFNFTIPEKEKIDLTIKYDEMENRISDFLLEDINANEFIIESNESNITFSWNEQSLADYYTLYLYTYDSFTPSIDSLWVLTEPFVAIPKNIFPDTSIAYFAVAASINGPLPNTSYYNSIRDMDIRFINYSASSKYFDITNRNQHDPFFENLEIETLFRKKLLGF